MKPAALKVLLRYSQPGDQLIYHRGELARDAAGDFDANDCRAIAQEAAMNGKVMLTQKRGGDGFDYLMTMRQKPEYSWLRPTWPETLESNWDGTEE